MINYLDNKEFNLDSEILGLPRSLTIVDGMVQGKTRERKKTFLDGSSDEIAEKLSGILLIPVIYYNLLVELYA